MHESELLRRLHALLAGSVALWNLDDVELSDSGEGTIEIRRADGFTVSVTQTPPAMRDIARWSVKSSLGTSRLCSSVLGVVSVVSEMLGVTQSQRVPLRVGVMGVAA
ncbi:hypothetical protein [Bordetella sp. 02P26C-1]|uniref:hypothetical protein n=1 Tax=Bordetella sp. 02P26C-1 TaxID=2683195 RepID=UPI00135584CF|nr:hypothetical protein [Bordetella sp. 02P26C-1]MVW77988.1 hypothetical protein [Bordetella sp. 02P26C-1]